MSSPQVTAAHVAPLEPECLTGTFDSFAGGCCHGFILLITSDIGMHMNVPFLAQGNEWPWDWFEDWLSGRATLAWNKV